MADRGSSVRDPLAPDAGQPGCGNDFVSRSRVFATARLGVYECCAGPETGFAARYRPKLGRQVVRLTTTPEAGYLTRNQALDAAIEFRKLCRAVFATATASGVPGSRQNTEAAQENNPELPRPRSPAGEGRLIGVSSLDLAGPPARTGPASSFGEPA